MTINEIQDEIIKDFKGHKDWTDRYGHLIKLGKKLPQACEGIRCDDNLIKGCQVRTWYGCKYDDGKMKFDIDSVSAVTQGFIYLLLKVFNGQKPEDIKDAELYFIDKIGFRENFSPIRANSLWKLNSRIKSDAEMYSAE